MFVTSFKNIILGFVDAVHSKMTYGLSSCVSMFLRTVQNYSSINATSLLGRVRAFNTDEAINETMTEPVLCFPMKTTNELLDAITAHFIADNNTLYNALLYSGQEGDYVVIKANQLHYFLVKTGDKVEVFPSQPTLLNQLRLLKDPFGIEVSLKNQVHTAVSNAIQLLTIDLIERWGKREYNSRELQSSGAVDVFAILQWINNYPISPDRDRLMAKVLPFFSICFGHIFGIDGLALGAENISMEGFPSGLEMAILAPMLQVQINQHVNDLKLRQMLLKMLESAPAFSALPDDPYAPSQATDKQIAEQINQGKTVTFSTGFLSHSTNITMNKNFLVYTNRGARNNGTSSGMWLYTITKPITAEVIGRLRRQTHEAKDDSYFVPGPFSMHVDLGLKDQILYPMSEQKVGNCVFANNIPCIRAANIIYAKENRNNSSYNSLHRTLKWSLKVEFVKYWCSINNHSDQKQWKKNHFTAVQKIGNKFFGKKRKLDRYQVQVLGYINTIQHYFRKFVENCRYPLDVCFTLDRNASLSWKAVERRLLDSPVGSFTIIKNGDKSLCEFDYFLLIHIPDQIIECGVDATPHAEKQFSVQIRKKNGYFSVVGVDTLAELAQHLTKLDYPLIFPV